MASPISTSVTSSSSSTRSSFSLTATPSATNVLNSPGLLALILEHLHDLPSVLARLARVDRKWYAMAMDILWRDVLHGGMRPILYTLPEYSEIDGQPMLSAHPQRMSWTRFEYGVASRIDTLRLDLKTLFVGSGARVSGRRVLQDVFGATTSGIHTPHLRKLHVTMDLDMLHVDVLSRLDLAKVEHLSLEVYSPLDEGNLRMMTDFVSVSLGSLFGFIALRLENLRSLRLLLPTASLLSPAWPEVTEALTRLPLLHTLIMPPFSLPHLLLFALSEHPRLARIYAHGLDRDLIWTDALAAHTAVFPPLDDDVQDTMLLHLPIPPHGPRIALAALTHLTLTASLQQLTMLLERRPALPRLQSLRVILPAQSTLPDLFQFFRTVATAFPVLRALHVAQLRFTNPVVCIDAGRLRPLRALAGLETLVLRASAPFEVGASALADLTAHWPRLRTLVLDDAAAAGGTSHLPLGSALATLRTVRPELEVLALPVHPLLDGAAPCAWPALRALRLVLTPPFAACPEEVARFLHALGNGCLVNLSTRGCDEWAGVTALPRLDDNEDTDAARKYVRACVDAWKSLVRAEGKVVGSQWVDEVAVEMMVARRM